MYLTWVWTNPLSNHTHVRKKLDFEDRPLPGLSLSAWDEELGNDPDRNFILSGIENGFDIIDDVSQITPREVDNHPSAKPSSPLYEAATQQVLKEIYSGNYVICDTPPKIVSLMAAIPKSDGEVRLIYDCSRPIGAAVNDYCLSEWKLKFSCIDDASKLMTPGCFFC